MILIDAGKHTMIGGRIKRILSHVANDDAFCLTYGDGVANMEITRSIAFHRQEGRLATVTAVQPPGRFGAINHEGSRVTGFQEEHYQLPPAAEIKVVRCIRGALYDAIIDLRPDSPTFGRWFGAELTAENRLMMYVPRGFAHGLLTLVDDTEAFYLVSALYAPAAERGVRFDDPRFGVAWPRTPVEVSSKDRAWPDFDAAFHGTELLRGLL